MEVSVEFCGNRKVEVDKTPAGDTGNLQGSTKEQKHEDSFISNLNLSFFQSGNQIYFV